jgi:hypothetical protein
MLSIISITLSFLTFNASGWRSMALMFAALRIDPQQPFFSRFSAS